MISSLTTSAVDGQASHLAREAEPPAIFTFVSKVFFILIVHADHVDRFKLEGFSCQGNL